MGAGSPCSHCRALSFNEREGKRLRSAVRPFFFFFFFLGCFGVFWGWFAADEGHFTEQIARCKTGRRSEDAGVGGV